MRRVVSAFVAALMALIWLMPLASAAQTVPWAEVTAYTYDPLFYDAPGSGNAQERGPPAEHHIAFAYDSVDHWSRGYSARPEELAAPSSSTYAYLVPPGQVARTSTTTGLQVVLAGADLSSPKPTGVAANGGGSTFYTVQSADDAARLASGGTPWPTSATRAEFGPGVYAWGNLDDAASYAAQLEKRGACVQICEFSLNTSNLRRVDVDSLADPSDYMSKYSQLWGGTPSHGADYITRGTQFGTQHYFSPNAFGSAAWGGPR